VFAALGIQYAKHMRRVIGSSVACLTLQYFSTLSHNGTIFEKKKSLDLKRVFIFSTTCV